MSQDVRWRQLQDRLIALAVLACRVGKRLPRGHLGQHLVEQLIRSATSPAPNYAEAQGAESRKDFIHKMRICLKELRETNVWLQLIGRLGLASGDELKLAVQEAEELIAIFTRSVLTATRNSTKGRQQNSAAI